MFDPPKVVKTAMFTGPMVYFMDNIHLKMDENSRYPHDYHHFGNLHSSVRFKSDRDISFGPSTLCQAAMMLKRAILGFCRCCVTGGPVGLVSLVCNVGCNKLALFADMLWYLAAGCSRVSCEPANSANSKVQRRVCKIPTDQVNTPPVMLLTVHTSQAVGRSLLGFDKNRVQSGFKLSFTFNFNPWDLPEIIEDRLIIFW